MRCISHYDSPLGKVLLEAEEERLTGLWFEGQKYFPDCRFCEKRELPVFQTAKNWLDVYFSGNEPDFEVPLRFEGTEFQNMVWEILCGIPYGHTATYGEIAGEIAKRRGLEYMSARAAGNVVGHNRISILVPCHRVVGADGSLTGYAGGTDRKRALLELESRTLPGKRLLLRQR